MIASLSATFAFAGGYALLDTMQPATTRTQASSRSADHDDDDDHADYPASA